MTVNGSGRELQKPWGEAGNAQQSANKSTALGKGEGLYCPLRGVETPYLPIVNHSLSWLVQGGEEGTCV